MEETRLAKKYENEVISCKAKTEYTL